MRRSHLGAVVSVMYATAIPSSGGDIIPANPGTEIPKVTQPKSYYDPYDRKKKRHKNKKGKFGQ
jgi:hypothetical protein